ncbi:histidine kinase [Nonomuraea sp. NBC_01738]|uniref:sensor histidine kinase n=1 Tax=Nonomuraea sp. NBC_01738 TaxID=2976003 RepID=UPI002E0E055B|nr:histidine kinase [Nonomuraea sp. NBC_01738]
MRWRWRGVPLDLLLAASGVGLDLLVSSGGAGLRVTVLLHALLAGLPLGFLRRHPAPVALYLSALLVYTDQVDSLTSNTAQILLCLAVGMTAYRMCWRWTLTVVGASWIATAINIADPGIAFTSSAWMYSAGIGVFPALIGGYLRRPAARLEERSITPDVLLAAGGAADAVLSTWTSWHTADLPVWVVGILAVGGGLSLGVVRRVPGAVFLLQGTLLVVADTFMPSVVNTCMILTLIAIGVFAMRVASWMWTGLIYFAGCALAALAVVEPDVTTTPARAIVLMALVATPIAIGRYLGARQAAQAAERLRARESARLAVSQVRADQLAERERIAREVHDIVAHHVGAMVLRAGAARYAAPDGPAADALNDIRLTGHQVLEDLRGLLAVLRDPERDPDLPADPGALVREAAERMTTAGLVVELDVAPGAEHAPLVARASAARIVQEGLTNVLKHAGPGTAVAVTVLPLSTPAACPSRCATAARSPPASRCPPPGRA